MTDERIGVTSYPLYWPVGWPRAPRRRRASFRDSNVYVETQEVRAELQRLGARAVIVSANLQLRNDGVPYAGQKTPSDTGIAVWFELRSGAAWQQHVLACDRWDKAEHNLRAIALHIDSLRGQGRWGVGSVQQAFQGYKALPERAGGVPWWEILGVDPQASRDAVERAFKRRAHERHPDKGGAIDAWHELQQAREQALAACAP